jgi:hypothetical protein
MGIGRRERIWKILSWGRQGWGGGGGGGGVVKGGFGMGWGGAGGFWGGLGVFGGGLGLGGWGMARLLGNYWRGEVWTSGLG